MAPKKEQIEELKKSCLKVVEVQADCDKIQEVLAANESNSSVAALAEQKILSLHKRKQVLHADIALGKSVDQVELKQVDDEIAVAQREIDGQLVTVDGLRRRLELGLVDLSTAKYQKAVLVSQFIRSEAEEIHAEYMELAKDLAAKFRRLKALGMIYGRQEYSPEPFSMGSEQKFFSIPVFQFASSGQWPPNASVSWPKWQTGVDIAIQTQYMNSDVEVEEMRLAGLGIQL